jgi:hypothetical protein
MNHTRLVVPRDLHSQQETVALLSTGHCGWLDAAGQLGAVGWPRAVEDRRVVG